MGALKAWWAQASARDQMVLVIGCGFLVMYVLFMGVLKPVYEMRSKEETKNDALRKSLENVRVLAAQVAVQRKSGSGARSSSLEKIVQQSVGTNRLQVSSMNAAGKSGLRLRFEEAPFENILRWLYEMEISHNLIIKDLSIAAAAGSGMVTVNLRLQQE